MLSSTIRKMFRREPCEARKSKYRSLSLEEQVDLIQCFNVNLLFLLRNKGIDITDQELKDLMTNSQLDLDVVD